MDLLLTGLTESLKENRISGAKLERANRHYHFISQINQAIVHLKDANTLFRKSCDIALQFGKFQIAWIGSFDKAQKKILLLNSCGISAEEIELFNELPHEINGPEDFVLQTGNYFLCNSVEQFNKVKSWKLFAEKHRLGSFIVLPIKKGGAVFGTFNLYSKESNYFSQEHITLLEEVSGDISFALDMFEKAERHNEAEIELQNNFAELETVSNQQTAILNTLPASIALLDNEGNILKVNDEWIQFGQENGLEPDYQYLSKNYIEICEKSFGRDKYDGQKMAMGLNEILSGNKDYFTMEYPCDSSTEKRWFKAEVRPFKSFNLTGAIVMHFSISDRKKAEAEMLLLINNTEESFILLNNKLQVVSFNNQFKNLYQKNFGLEISKGDYILDYAAPNRRELVASIYEKVLAGNVQEYEIELPGLNNLNQYYSLKYSPAKDESGNIFGAFVTMIDITEKRIAQDQKEFERRNKEALINRTDDLIWSISTDFKLVAANMAFIKEMKEFTGIEIKAGDDFLNYDEISDESLEFWGELYKKAFTGEAFKTEAYNPPTKNKDQSWIDVCFSPIFVNEQMVGIACYSRDITDRKIAEFERTKITNDLLQRNRDLEQFTFIVSHNLRAPTANIIGFAEYLQNGNLTKDEQKEFLNGLEASALRLDNIIKDINSILQVKHEVNEKTELISFSKLVNDIFDSFGNINNKKHVRFISDFSEVDEILSFKAYLQSIFYNLISNSIKYCRPEAQPFIEIKSKKEIGKIILTFRDNGLGIDLKRKGDKLFNLYARFHAHEEGKGMGLFMVKTQVEAIGGTVSIDSEVNVGTEFTITLKN